MTGDGYSGFYKFGLTGGFFANTVVNDEMKVQYELIYIGKGSNNPAEPDKGIYNSYKIHLNYIQVPVMFKYQLKKFEFEVGPALGVFVSSKEWDQFGERAASASPFDWRPLELDGIIGANYYVVEDKMFFNIRAQHSIFSIVKSTVVTQWGIYGGAWNITLAASFNYQF